MQGTHVHHKNHSKNNETIQDERCTQDNCVGCIIYEHAMYDKGTQQNCVRVASGIRLSLFLVAEAVLATVASSLGGHFYCYRKIIVCSFSDRSACTPPC